MHGLKTVRFSKYLANANKMRINT